MREKLQWGKNIIYFPQIKAKKERIFHRNKKIGEIFYIFFPKESENYFSRITE